MRLIQAAVRKGDRKVSTLYGTLFVLYGTLLVFQSNLGKLIFPLLSIVLDTHNCIVCPCDTVMTVIMIALCVPVTVSELPTIMHGAKLITPE